jgi:sialate O-acetylesterase
MRPTLTAALLLALAPLARADVKLPTIFGSHMVLQRDKPINVWGWAEKGEKVTVTLGSEKAEATADDDGNWKVSLKAQKANKTGQSLTVEGKNKVTLDDVLIGEVWIGSGQSNMQQSVADSANAKETIAAAARPNVRLYLVPLVEAPTPAKDVKATWTTCTPKAVPNFSAVLYEFGIRLQKDLDVPVGLIASSWGGSAIEPWTVTEKGSGRKHNAMIAPITQLAIRGIIWYQGESNVNNGYGYFAKKEALIKGWRKAFNNKDMPFLFVQIAPWSGYGPGKLPELWEAQVACLKIPNTGMAVTTDIVHNIADIHPKDKFNVGNRLALWALAKTYGKKDLVYSGPLYKGIKIDGSKAILSFAQTGGGLKARDEKPLSEFEIAGEDGKFVPAEAKIEGDKVVVMSKDVEKPTQVRFGWKNTANPNLMNKEGLPASPFRTKDWKGGTGEGKAEEPSTE